MTSTTTTHLPTAELREVDALWRAANYLSVGQIYLLDNPLLREPLRLEHVKPRLLGHWGTTPGLNLPLRPPEPRHPQRRADAIYVTGPGHGGPGARREHLARRHLQRASTRASPATGRACGGSSGSSPSPAASRATSRPRRPARSTRAASSATRCPTPTAPRSTTPTCSCCCVIGDGEAETGPLARAGTRTSSSTRRRDGAVLPILHLNGYKIANPTVLARIPQTSCARCWSGYGHAPRFVEGDDPEDGAPGDGRRARRGLVDEIARHPAGRRAPGRRRASGRAGR